MENYLHRVSENNACWTPSVRLTSGQKDVSHTGKRVWKYHQNVGKWTRGKRPITTVLDRSNLVNNRISNKRRSVKKHHVAQLTVREVISIKQLWVVRCRWLVVEVRLRLAINKQRSRVQNETKRIHWYVNHVNKSIEQMCIKKISVTSYKSHDSRSFL